MHSDKLDHSLVDDHIRRQASAGCHRYQHLFNTKIYPNPTGADPKQEHSEQNPMMVASDEGISPST